MVVAPPLGVCQAEEYECRTGVGGRGRAPPRGEPGGRATVARPARLPGTARPCRANLGLGLAQSRVMGHEDRQEQSLGKCTQARGREGTVSGAGELSPACMAVISELPASGKLVGKDRLRQATGLRLKEYENAVAELLDMGIVRAGPGRGGSLGLVAARSQHGSGGKAPHEGARRHQQTGDLLLSPAAKRPPARSATALPSPSASRTPSGRQPTSYGARWTPPSTSTSCSVSCS